MWMYVAYIHNACMHASMSIEINVLPLSNHMLFWCHSNYLWFGRVPCSEEEKVWMEQLLPWCAQEEVVACSISAPNLLRRPGINETPKYRSCFVLCMCVYMYMYMYMYVCVCVSMDVCVCVWMDGWMQVCMHACMCAFMRVQIVFVCIYSCIWTCLSTYFQMHMYVSMHAFASSQVSKRVFGHIPKCVYV